MLALQEPTELQEFREGKFDCGQDDTEFELYLKGKEKGNYGL